MRKKSIKEENEQMANEILEAVQKLSDLSDESNHNDRICRIEFWHLMNDRIFVKIVTGSCAMTINDPVLKDFPQIKEILESIKYKKLNVEIMRLLEKGIKEMPRKYGWFCSEVFEDNRSFIVSRR